MKQDMTKVKTRTLPQNNYHSIWFNGKTIRQAIDQKKPVVELEWPEFYDVKVTNYCRGGCTYCYQDSVVTAKHPDKLIEKFQSIFEPMTINERPFQIAFGGGEPTEHPDFLELLKVCSEFGICPNYTTNGMIINDEILEVVKKYCGGVALSTHTHLEKFWTNALVKYSDAGIRTNLHVIISNEASIERFLDYYKKWGKYVEYFVLLPYMAVGRAKETNLAFQNLFDELIVLDTSKIAFGSNFFPHIKNHPISKKLDISLYEPEIMSKYIDMTNMKCYKSSFNLTEVPHKFLPQNEKEK